jgi:hypothetical protein
MRFALCVAAACLLSACSTQDWQGRAELATRFSNADARALAMDQPNSSAGNCERTAQERAIDLRFQGFDEDMQQRVYATAYAECIAWQKRLAR